MHPIGMFLFTGISELLIGKIQLLRLE